MASLFHHGLFGGGGGGLVYIQCVFLDVICVCFTNHILLRWALYTWRRAGHVRAPNGWEAEDLSDIFVSFGANAGYEKASLTSYVALFEYVWSFGSLKAFSGNGS